MLRDIVLLAVAQEANINQSFDERREALIAQSSSHDCFRFGDVVPFTEGGRVATKYLMLPHIQSSFALTD